MGRLKAFLDIIRPVNALMMGLSILVGVVISAGLEIKIPFLSLGLAFLTGFSLTGSAMVINDYFDREVDSINEPSRPIPSGLVKPNEAIIYSIFLSLIGLIASFFAGYSLLMIACLAWFIMMAYSAYGKKTGFIGNLMVSACIALPFLYGGVMVGRLSTSFIFSLLAFLSNTGREVTKGIVDVKGDTEQKVKTIAVLYGSKKAALLASALSLTAVVVSVAPIYLGYVSIWYIPLVLVTDFGLIYNAYSLLKNHDRDNSRRVKNITIYWMLFGLLAFCAGNF